MARKILKRPQNNSQKTSVLVSSIDALRSIINRNTETPTWQTGTEALKDANVKISWKNIWCSGYDEYTPLQYYLVRQDNTLLPLDEFDPEDYIYLRDRVLVRPVFEDIGMQRRQKVVKLYHHMAETDVPWAPLNYSNCKCPPGPHAELGYLLNQYKVIRDPEDEKKWTLKKCPPVREILLEGGRGSGKSEDFFLVLQRGKPNAHPDKPHEQCYLNHPAFRVLILRKNKDDLTDFFDRVERFLRNQFEITAINRSDYTIQLSTGAKLFFGHLKDESAFSNYIGHEYHTIWIEELGLIASEALYTSIKTCARPGAYSEIIPLVASSTNPGGQGASWIEDYFINVLDNNGDVIPASELIYNPISQTWRCRIHSTVLDNPYHMKVGYDKELQSIKGEALRRQWLEGSWDIKSGVMYTEFRKRRVRFCDTEECTCQQCEPKHAVHVVDADDHISPIHPRPNFYDPLIIGGDIGFTHHAAFIKGRMKPNTQLHVTGVLCQAGKTLRQWGVDIGEWIAAELTQIPSHRAVLFLSPEAFGQRGHEFTQAQQLNEGICKVLGPKASIVASLNDFSYADDDDVKENNKRQWTTLNQQKELRLIIRPANSKRVEGWNWLHELLRWESLTTSFDFVFDPRYAQQLFMEGKVNEYHRYYNMYERSQKGPQQEVLPKLVMDSTCTKLISAIPKLINDEKKADDVKDQKQWWNDVADALRYMIMGYKTVVEDEPEAVFVDKKMQQLAGRYALNNKEMSPEQRMMAMMQAQYDFHAKDATRNTAFSIDRSNGEVYMQ